MRGARSSRRAISVSGARPGRANSGTSSPRPPRAPRTAARGSRGRGNRRRMPPGRGRSRRPEARNPGLLFPTRTGNFERRSSWRWSSGRRWREPPGEPGLRWTRTCNGSRPSPDCGPPIPRERRARRGRARRRGQEGSRRTRLPPPRSRRSTSRGAIGPPGRSPGRGPLASRRAAPSRAPPGRAGRRRAPPRPPRRAARRACGHRRPRRLRGGGSPVSARMPACVSLLATANARPLCTEL